MSTIRVSKSVLASALAATVLCASHSAQAGENWCLTRSEASGDVYNQIETLASAREWSTKVPIIIHSDRGWSECSLRSASCNVATGDLISLIDDERGGLKLQRMRLDGGPVVRDTATMAIDSQGRFISGFSRGSDGVGQQVVLYYTGTHYCTDSGMDYAADAQCRFFEFEVYPVGLDQSHRPDLAVARWNRAQCPTAAQQPGSGGGHDPPRP